ncbi:MAG: hypothetical protein U9N49_06030 [Campylobacterota bacterium]|nr:hypothetical protein [Campylobacterota bacterium]
MRRAKRNLKSSNKGLYILLGIVVVLIIPLFFEATRTFIIALLWRAFFFIKEHIVALFVSFFLIKGKFIWLMFLKKITVLTTIGLGKRYVTEKIIMHNFKKHFLDHLKEEIDIIKVYITKTFRRSPVMKKVIAILAFIASLSYVTKFMGLFLALKVLLARMWSFLLALFLKIGTTTAYFFTDYLWNSFIAPLIEILIFSWLIELLERIPTFKRWFAKIYQMFYTTFKSFEAFLERYLHIPIERFLAVFVRRIQKKVRRLADTQTHSIRDELLERRANRQNLHQKILDKRAIYWEGLFDYSYQSTHQKLIAKRKSNPSIYHKIRQRGR